MKNISRERKILENKRLDLDSCKNKVRKARAMQLQPVVSAATNKDKEKMTNCLLDVLTLGFIPTPTSIQLRVERGH